MPMSNEGEVGEVVKLCHLYGLPVAADLIERQQQEIEVLKSEAEHWVDDHGTTWTRPTAWAYAQVCKLKERQQQEIGDLILKLGAQDAEVIRLKEALTQIAEVCHLERQFGRSKSCGDFALDIRNMAQQEIERLRADLASFTDSARRPTSTTSVPYGNALPRK